MGLKKTRDVRKQTFFLFIALVVAMVSCTDDDLVVVTTIDPILCDSLSVSYAQYIQPIISLHCSDAVCHGDSSTSDIYLRNYEEVKKEAELGVFLKAVKHEKGASWMPFNQARLPESDLDLIECWIQDGHQP